MRFVLSQASDPLQRPRSVPPGGSFDSKLSIESPSSSLEVLRPFSVQGPANRSEPESPAARFHPDNHPSPVFRRPSRVLSSLTPAALFHAAAAHGVSVLQSFSLRSNSSGLVTRRSPPSVSSALPKKPGRTPRGLRSPAIRIPRWSIASLAGPMLSWTFIASTAFLRLGLESSLDASSAHDLHFGTVLARVRS